MNNQLSVSGFKTQNKKLESSWPKHSTQQKLNRDPFINIFKKKSKEGEGTGVEIYGYMHTPESEEVILVDEDWAEKGCEGGRVKSRGSEKEEFEIAFGVNPNFIGGIHGSDYLFNHIPCR